MYKITSRSAKMQNGMRRSAGTGRAQVRLRRHDSASVLNGEGGAACGKAQIFCERLFGKRGKLVCGNAVARQLIEERADERVAGAGRVRDGHGDRRGLRMAGRRIRRRAIRAACHDHHADAEGEQLFRCRPFVGAAGDEFDLVIAQLDQIRTGQELPYRRLTVRRTAPKRQMVRFL